MIDQLIFLLSTDWFESYWSTIAIVLDELKVKLVKEGCREIVGQIVAGAEEYWLTSFSEERKRETRSRLDSLIQKLDISGFHIIAELWTILRVKIFN
jgi:hypothetical protein